MGRLVHGVYTPDIDLTNLNKMKEVIIMGNLDAKETSELVFAVGKLVTSGKLAKEDDGKITAGDAMHFTDDVLPLISGIRGADKIPAEFADGYDAADREQITTAWTESAELLERDEVGGELALKVAYAINELLIHLGTVKPSAPPVE